jgi:hypothetical protein
MLDENIGGVDLDDRAAKEALIEAATAKAKAKKQKEKSLDDALGDLKPLDEVKLIDDQ